MRRMFLAVFFVLCCNSARAQGPKTEVDLLLVLAADVSRSVDYEKFLLQRQGYISALRNHHVIGAMTSGPRGKVALTYVEWSSQFEQQVVVGWSVIGSESAAQAFASTLGEAKRSFTNSTSISGALEFSGKLLEEAPFTSLRQTIDVSGDGTNNNGSDPRSIRDQLVRKGVVINGLAILTTDLVPGEALFRYYRDHVNPPGGLTRYYETHVMGGPGSFVITADQNFVNFAPAIQRKLVREIALLRR